MFSSIDSLGSFTTVRLAGGEVKFRCSCGKMYKHKCHLRGHQRHECGKEPQFACPHCPYKAKQKSTLKTHIAIRHMQCAFE
ncbi:longitudinals lacking protein, isoforms A/B/D/L-like [Homalodisca vitripennis]|uniref:longitudinals lacking protein, isoforms A/B/D/L-like n=1 Tax=Homalodisca vitripennis TaxID=197043 RepID=UPI001EEB03B4|nr:longitudinals lacking protein, isoforms A/B/D/L-like [Homalodisca vitripennis]KAG8259310.1 hypothetical protein J6590_014779 [Homalodisca vitripennis]